MTKILCDLTSSGSGAGGRGAQRSSGNSSELFSSGVRGDPGGAHLHGEAGAGARGKQGYQQGESFASCIILLESGTFSLEHGSGINSKLITICKMLISFDKAVVTVLWEYFTMALPDSDLEKSRDSILLLGMCGASEVTV